MDRPQASIAGTPEYAALSAADLAGAVARIPEILARIKWSPGQIRQEREARLRQLLQVARERSPWHRERLARVGIDHLGDQELATLPMMTKTDLVATFDRIVTDPRLTLDLVNEHISNLTAGAPSDLSQRRGLPQHPLPKTGLEAAHRDDVYPPAQECFQLKLEPAQVEKRPTGLKLHEEIDVACGVSVTPGPRAEHAHVVRPVPGGDPQNVLALTFQHLLKGHVASAPDHRQPSRPNGVPRPPARAITSSVSTSRHVRRRPTRTSIAR